MAYLVPDHPDQERTKSLARRKHATNPTVLHEAYHTCVFKLRRNPAVTVRALLDYMSLTLCLPINSATVELGLELALEHHLGGRDALILASYANSDQVNSLVTFDESLQSVKHVRVGRRDLKIVDPVFVGKRNHSS